MEPPLKHSCLCKNLLLSCWFLSSPEYRYQLPRYCHHQFPHKIRLFLSNNPSPAMFSIIYKLFRSNTSNSTPTGTKQLLLFPLRIVSVDVHAQKLILFLQHDRDSAGADIWTCMHMSETQSNHPDCKRVQHFSGQLLSTKESCCYLSKASDTLISCLGMRWSLTLAEIQRQCSMQHCQL